VRAEPLLGRLLITATLPHSLYVVSVHVIAQYTSTMLLSVTNAIGVVVILGWGEHKQTCLLEPSQQWNIIWNLFGVAQAKLRCSFGAPNLVVIEVELWKKANNAVASLLPVPEGNLCTSAAEDLGLAMPQ